MHRLDPEPEPFDIIDTGPFRSLASAIIRRAVDDLTVPDQRRNARVFLLHEYQHTIWQAWVPIAPRVIAEFIETHRRRQGGYPRVHRRPPEVPEC